MSIYSAALLEIAFKVHDQPHQQLTSTTMQDILQILQKVLGGTERCQCTYWRIIGSECEIVAGVPLERHGVGKIFPLVEHHDIQHVIELLKTELEGNVSFIIDNPLTHPLTAYFREKIEKEKINATFYNGVKQDEAVNQEEISCVIFVVDAIGKKIAFESDEEELCKSIGKLFASLNVSYDEFLLTLDLLLQEISLQDWRHFLLNRLETIGGLSDRLRKKLQKFKENPENINIASLDAALIEAEKIHQEVSKIVKITPHYLIQY